MNTAVRVVIVVSVLFWSLAGHAPAQEPIQVKLTSTPLGEPGVVLSAWSFHETSKDRPIIYYKAYDSEVLLPKHRVVFSPRKAQHVLKIADVTCALICPQGKPTLIVPGGVVKLKPAALGYESVAVPLAGKDPYLIAFPRAFSFKDKTTVFYRCGLVRTGTVAEEPIRLYDDDLDGVYRSGKDGLCVGDSGKVGIFAPVSDLLPTTTAVYRVERIEPDGTAMTLRPYTGQTGKLKFELAGGNVECRVALVSKDGKCSFGMLAGEQALTVPAGTYRLLYGYLYHPSSRRAVALMLPGRGLPITVAGNAEVTLTLGEKVVEEALDQEHAVLMTFEALLEIDLTGIEQACDSGDFDKAQALFKEIADRYKGGPNYEATRGWMESLRQRLELETSPEGKAFRDAEATVLTLVKHGNLPAAKVLAGEAQKAFARIPAKYANSAAYRARKARAEALARYGEGAMPGLQATYFGHRFRNKTGAEVVEKVDWDRSPQGGKAQFFCCRYEGFLVIPVDGEYELFLASDEGARLFLDGEKVIDHWGAHILAEKSVKLNLTAGPHPLKIEMYQGLGGAALHFRWTPPGGRKSMVPFWALECRKDQAQD